MAILEVFMKLNSLPDRDLISQTKQLVQTERDVLTKILQHLREIERRRLFSDFGCSSLFDYAVKELKYSEPQAARRLQAMRLIKEIPEVEKKIESGELSLSNISQAQSFFREIKRASDSVTEMPKAEKLEILSKLENKSARDGQRVLLKIHPQAAIPKERERILTDDQSEIRFVMSQELRAKLEEVRSLLGIKGATMSFAELLSHMSDMSVETLRAKRFGKARASATTSQPLPKVRARHFTPELRAPTQASTFAPAKTLTKNTRYISKELRHHIWQRDGRKCVKCKGSKNLNIDHIKPFALGGTSEEANLRLLCFSCNQRAGIRTFGKMSREISLT